MTAYLSEQLALNRLLRERDHILKNQAGKIMNAVPTENLGGIFDKDAEGNNSPQPVFNPQEAARELVFKWVTEGLAGDSQVFDANITLDDVYVVWFCKTLQNWKCLISTTITDGRYYEVTFNGNENVAYIDTYKKTHNQAVLFGGI